MERMGSFLAELRKKYNLPPYLIGGIGGLIGIALYVFFHNRMIAFTEDCIYGGQWNEYKGREDSSNEPKSK